MILTPTFPLPTAKSTNTPQRLMLHSRHKDTHSSIFAPYHLPLVWCVGTYHIGYHDSLELWLWQELWQDLSSNPVVLTLLVISSHHLSITCLLVFTNGDMQWLGPPIDLLQMQNHPFHFLFPFCQVSLRGKQQLLARFCVLFCLFMYPT